MSAIEKISEALTYDAVETAIMSSLSLACAVAALQCGPIEGEDVDPVSYRPTELAPTTAPKKTR
jgi:hypothetical protein